MIRSRTTRPIAAVAAPIVACLALGIAAEARGQVVAAPGYGGYGWGGWGTDSAVGAGFRGMGAFAQGLGAGDLQSAQADAIRTQSFMELNEYLYRSARAQRQLAAAARQAAADRASEARDALQDRRSNDPTPREIESGGALNTILFDLDNPAIPDSVVRDAADGMAIPGAAVQKVPFMFTHRGVAISLQRLTNEGEGWPPALRAEAFAPLRERYDDLVGRIIDLPEGEPVPPEMIDEARGVLREMYRGVQAAGLDGPVAAEALRHLKAQAGMVAMLQQPDVKQLIDEAADVEQVAIPTLLHFMRVFNLQFGAAETPEEKAVYSQELYPKMARLRDSIAEQYGGSLPGSDSEAEEQPGGSPAGAFEGFGWDQLGLPSGEETGRDAPPAREDGPAPSLRDR